MRFRVAHWDNLDVSCILACNGKTFFERTNDKCHLYYFCQLAYHFVT